MKTCKMKPKKPQEDIQLNLFKIELRSIISPNHELVLLAEKIDWQSFGTYFGKNYHPTHGRPALPTRLMVGLHYLKYAFALSDESVLQCWLENPYWQYFTGGIFFEHDFPFDSSSMTKWRKKLGEKGAEKLLSELITSGVKNGFIKKTDLKRVNVDTTVQTKNIAYPTDARLYNKMREKLVAKAIENGINLRQSYSRTGVKLLSRQQNYSRARQFKRSVKMTKKLRNILGRTIRDIERKNIPLDQELINLLKLANRLYKQKKQDKKKLYSLHETAVECISKGKINKHYEFGCKVGFVTSAKSNWILGAKAFHDNPYDGHTLSDCLNQAEEISKYEIVQAVCDLGYRGHDYKGNVNILLVPRNKRKKLKSLRYWWNRRSAIEPIIGHQKAEHLLERNRLKGTDGDKVNAVMAACGFNFRKLMKAFWLLFYWMIFNDKTSRNTSKLIKTGYSY